MKEHHWFIMWITKKNIYNLYYDKDFVVTMDYHKIRKNMIIKMIRNFSKQFDEYDELMADIENEIEFDKWKEQDGKRRTDKGKDKNPMP